jgi:hypothetical protein
MHFYLGAMIAEGQVKVIDLRVSDIGDVFLEGEA